MVCGAQVMAACTRGCRTALTSMVYTLSPVARSWHSKRSKRSKRSWVVMPAMQRGEMILYRTMHHTDGLRCGRRAIGTSKLCTSSCLVHLTPHPTHHTPHPTHHTPPHYTPNISVANIHTPPHLHPSPTHHHQLTLSSHTPPLHADTSKLCTRSCLTRPTSYAVRGRRRAT
jgi:hypothetical protein